MQEESWIPLNEFSVTSLLFALASFISICIHRFLQISMEMWFILGSVTAAFRCAYYIVIAFSLTVLIITIFWRTCCACLFQSVLLNCQFVLLDLREWITDFVVMFCYPLIIDISYFSNESCPKLGFLTIIYVSVEKKSEAFGRGSFPSFDTRTT